MSRKWRGDLAGLAVAMVAFWVFAGCPGSMERSEDDSSGPGGEGGEVEGEAIVANATADEDGLAADWPDGWLVVRQEEWMPVLDAFGRSLHAARDDFRNGDREAAAAEIRRGIAFLEAQITGASVRDRGAGESAIATLRELAERLSGDEEVTLEQLDIALANAYRFDLEREALVDDSSSEPYLDRPGAHLRLAVARYLENEPDEAAREIDRASAYLRLEGNRHDEAGERAQLVEAAQDLERVAARVRAFEIGDSAELGRAFEPSMQLWRRLAGDRASSPQASSSVPE